MHHRVNWIDNLKALAIFLVVLGHSINGGVTSTDKYAAYLCDWIYSFHMPLFFLLSGITYQLASSNGKTKRTSTSQIVNIGIIYIVQSLIYILFNVISQRFINPSNIYTLKDGAFVLFTPIAHFWFLHTLIIYYIVDYILCRLLKKNSLIFLTTLILSLLSFCIPFDYISKILYLLFFFELGRAMHFFSKIPIIIIIVGTIYSFISPFISNHTLIFSYLDFIIAICVSLLLVYIFQKFSNRSINIITYAGKNCIWIYIFHSYFTSIARAICNRFIPQATLLRICVCTISGILFPLIMCFISQKLNVDFLVSRPIKLFKKKS